MGCAACARCCREFTFEVSGDAEWIARFTEFVELTRPGVFHGVPGGLKITIPCDYLKDGRCEVYEERPEICREFMCRKARSSPQ